MKKELMDYIVYSMVEGDEDFGEAFEWACMHMEISCEEGEELIKEEDFFIILHEVEGILFENE